MATSSRPLSPHLQIYRWQISNSLSVLHRFTGLVLTFAFMLLCLWLVAAACGPDTYASVTWILRGPLGIMVAIATAAVMFFHLLNGIRHLFWDVGMGFEKYRARRTGKLVLAVTVLMTLGLAVWVLA